MSQSRDYPGNLPLLPMGWGAANLDFDGAESFWDEAQRITASSSLGDNLDIALAGESSPRIWLFLHEPGHGALSCAAALEIARELGSRDQAVLILDCDDTDSQLTRWAGRHESEGWIDLVRYGASVLTSGVAMPFEGRRGYILGVGSFTPTDVVAQEAEDLINRLKRQADDLILVAPANETGKLWARLADIRLLCWDRARKSPELIERVSGSFEDAGFQLTGLIGFGLPEDGMILGADAGSPAEDSAEAEMSEMESEDDFSGDDTDDRMEAEDLHDIDYTEVDEDVDEDESGVASMDEETEEAEGEADAPLEDEAVPVGDKPGSGSSKVFWWAAVVSFLLIAVVSFYYLKYVRPGEEGLPADQPVAVAENTSEIISEPIPEQTPDQANDQNDHPTQEQTAPVEDEILVDEESRDSAGGLEGQPDEAQSTPAVSEVAEIVETQPEVVDESAPVFSMDPYLLEVGSDGWALHLYSFPDSASAVEETKRLTRRGFQTEIRPFEIKDRGRWYRVYVGSFVTKAEARKAQGPLMEKLNVDWARATEF